jgi:hypothetical protein
MKNLIQSLLAICLLFASVRGDAQVPVYSSYPSAAATIFLDFDGHTVEGTSWNAFGPIFCQGSNLTNDQITEVFNRVAEDYRPFNINITTDSTKYWTAPVFQRQRIIITITSSWYGSAGGVSYLNSFSKGDHTPSFVFSALLGYNTKRIGEATSHEMGHTLGLRHQSTYDNNCLKTAEYNSGTGTGEIGWAPIMGVGYYRNFTLWNHGTNPQGCNIYQDDLGIITNATNGFGYRTDDHPAAADQATTVTFSNNQFITEGVIEQITDKDVFKVVIPTNGRLSIAANPYNIGTGNTGSNLDMQLEVLDNNFNIVTTYNPETALNLSVDSLFTAGTYFMRVQGKGNVYAPEYASLGSYSISSTFIPLTALPLHKLELKGSNENNRHNLNWIIEADENIKSQVLEVSANNNRDFRPLTHLNQLARSFQNTATTGGLLHYRVQVTFDDGKTYYSNIVALRASENKGKPVITGNLIRNSISINSPSAFTYSIVDFNGRLIMKGDLVQGINNISTDHLSSGMYLVRFSNGQETYNEKIMKQ